jgi:hypothetical protein
MQSLIHDVRRDPLADYVLTGGFSHAIELHSAHKILSIIPSGSLCPSS